jgi:hypothetical protein
MKNAYRVFGKKISRETLFWRLEEPETKSYAEVNKIKNINFIRKQLQNIIYSLYLEICSYTR